MLVLFGLMLWNLTCIKSVIHCGDQFQTAGGNMTNRCPTGSATGYCLKNHTWTWPRKQGPPFRPFQLAMTPMDGHLGLQQWRTCGPDDLWGKGQGVIPQTGVKEFIQAAWHSPNWKDDSVCTVSQTKPKIVHGETFPATYSTDHNSKILTRLGLMHMIKTVS